MPERLDAIDGVGLLSPEDDDGRALDPLVDGGSVTREDKVESRVCADELEAVARKMALEEAARLGLGVGKKERCSNRHRDRR